MRTIWWWWNVVKLHWDEWRFERAVAKEMWRMEVKTEAFRTLQMEAAQARMANEMQLRLVDAPPPETTASAGPADEEAKV